MKGSRRDMEGEWRMINSRIHEANRSTRKVLRSRSGARRDIESESAIR
jgi:DNA-binding transcriptional regulator PaaX